MSKNCTELGIYYSNLLNESITCFDFKNDARNLGNDSSCYDSSYIINELAYVNFPTCYNQFNTSFKPDCIIEQETLCNDFATYTIFISLCFSWLLSLIFNLLIVYAGMMMLSNQNLTAVRINSCQLKIALAISDMIYIALYAPSMIRNIYYYVISDSYTYSEFNSSLHNYNWLEKSKLRTFLIAIIANSKSVSRACSIFTIGVMTFDRTVSVVRPFYYSRHCSPNFCRRLLIAGLFAILIMTFIENLQGVYYKIESQ